MIIMLKYSLKEGDFDKITKERGLQYYNDNMVEELYNFNSAIYAKINNYIVILGPKHYYCSCPCGFCCKHLYALFLKIKREGIPDNLMDKLNKMTKKKLITLLTKNISKNIKKSINMLKK